MCYLSNLFLKGLETVELGAVQIICMASLLFLHFRGEHSMNLHTYTYLSKLQNSGKLIKERSVKGSNIRDFLLHWMKIKKKNG